MTPEQCRAARAWLSWSQKDLSERANVAPNTVYEFETKRRDPMPNNIAALRRALENAGIRLLFDQNGEAAGIAAGDTQGEITRSRRRPRQ